MKSHTYPWFTPCKVKLGIEKLDATYNYEMTSFLRISSVSHAMTGTLHDMDATTRDQIMTLPWPPPTFQAFKFESRKTRIDWRLLHGVDVNPIVSSAPLSLIKNSHQHHQHHRARLISCVMDGSRPHAALKLQTTRMPHVTVSRSATDDA